MRKLTFFLAAIFSVLLAEKALCHGTNFAIEPESFNSFRYEEMRVEEAARLSIRTGRFLSVDPIINDGARKNPQMWNRYAYTSNNPINRVDPDGRNWFKIDGNWEWHKGSVYVDENGKKHRSNYTHLIVVQAVGQRIDNRATVFKTTLYNQNKVVYSQTTTSGGGGHNRIPAGDYFINADKKYSGPVYPNPNSPLGNPHSFSGIQRIPNDGWGPAVQDAYGSIRAYLHPFERNPPSSMLGNYFHGQAIHRGGVTHGCLCYGQDPTMLNYLWETNRSDTGRCRHSG